MKTPLPIQNFRQITPISSLNRHFPWLKFALPLLFLIIIGATISMIVINQKPAESAFSNIDTPENSPADEKSAAESPPASETSTGSETIIFDSPPQLDSNTVAYTIEDSLIIEPDRPEEEPTGDPTTHYYVNSAGIDGGAKLIAITFDDGPSATTTPQLLDLLKSKNVKATFFMLGSKAAANPDIVRRAYNEGHEIESHTQNHKELTTLSASDITYEITTGVNTICDILALADCISFIRPPYGSVNDTVRAYAGYPLIGWAVDTLDWQSKNVSAIQSVVYSKTFDGAIILFHDIYQTTVDSIAGVIDTLRARGYQFVTVKQLVAARGYTLSDGGYYGAF